MLSKLQVIGLQALYTFVIAVITALPWIFVGAPQSVSETFFCVLLNSLMLGLWIVGLLFLQTLKDDAR